ncbi:hypothetical protein [Burkholderia cepacia]|uniref:hypothetical protein n=1 Tax=Burkholderia cepacia TaxID=292 RepID=UPI002ABD5783|nr:hypothetical protein [Burkholderia cepacia]
MPMAIERKSAGFEGLWGNGAFFTALPFRSELYVADPNYAASENARLRLKIDATNVTQSHIFHAEK